MDEEALFAAALEKKLPAERQAFLAEACGGDAECLARLEALLHAHENPDPFLQPRTVPPASGPSVTVDHVIREGPGTILGPYKLLEQIGEGGFGVVFMAEQQQPVRRKVALKILKPGMDTRQVVARFEAERQALALMNHPNIAHVLDGGETASGRPYFVMELVKGVAVTDYCDQAQLTSRERLELFVDICSAVQHAHQKGIIHRDIKPSNVLVTLQDGKPLVKVIDFGIAKALGQQLTDKTLFTGFAQMIGTPTYMSPEQTALSNVDVDTRSDVYSLGVLLYELLTGTTPFDRERLREAGYDEMRRIIREEEPPKPSTRISTLGQAANTVSTQRKSDPKRLSQLCRGELDWIVMKALEKDRNRRYESASAFAADVQRYLHDEAVAACPPSAWYRFRKFARRNRGPLTTASVITAALMLVLAVVAGSVGWVVRDRAARQAEITRHVQDSLTAARTLLAGNQVARARQKLAEARSRIGDDRALLGSVADEIEALDAELDKFERFLELVEQAHEAEFPAPEALMLQADTAGRMVVAPRQTSKVERDAAKAIPYLLEALSCYGVLEQDDWSDQLERGLLGRDQVARVRRTAYQELVWLADDIARRLVDHRSGRRLSREESVRVIQSYLAKAETAGLPTPAFYRIRAACRAALGQKEEARADLQRARQTSGRIALDHLLLGLAAVDAGNKVAAVQQFEAALRVEPTHYWSLFELGHCLSRGPQEVDFTLAAATLTGCILRRPDHASAYRTRGYTYHRLKRTREAVQDYQQALRLQPRDLGTRHNLGLALAELGKNAEAEKEFREVLRLQPDHPEAHSSLGLALLKQGKHAEAEAECGKAVRLQPAFHLAHNNLGMSLYEQGKYAEAEREFREVVRLQPRDAVGYYNLGNALAREGKLADAEAAHRQALRLRPDLPDAHFDLGRALAAQGRFAEAEAAYRLALRLRPDIADMHYYLGRALAGQRKLAEAEGACREAIRLSPDWPEAHGMLGIALFDQGKYAGAESRFRKVATLRPGDALAHFNLGNALRCQGNLAGALTAYREAVRLSPDMPGAHNNLGRTLYELGKHAEAVKEYREALRLQPDYPDATYNLENALKGKGKVEELAALDAKLSRVLQGKAQPTDAAERISLAEFCQEHKKRYAAAARFYAAAFAAQPKLANNLSRPYRYNAACAAALAGCGQGVDAATLDDKERAQLRRQTLGWLRADLTAWGQLLAKEPDKTGAAVHKALRHWLQDADFAGIRGDALAKLPEAERQPWQQLWADVEQILRKTNSKDTKEKAAGR